MAKEIELLYEWTCQTRAAMLDFAEKMPLEDVTAEHPHIPMGSFRNLFVHMASTYMYWLKRVGLGEHVEWPQPEAYPDVAALRALFAEIDALVAEFIAQHSGDKLHEPIVREMNRREGRVRFTLTPFWLISNCITHEFNHKGQLLTSARARGHKFEGRSDMATPPGGYEVLEPRA